MSGVSRVKVVLLGDSGSGKRQLVKRYVNNKFTYDSPSTIGVDFDTKVVHFHGEKIRYQMWDVQGVHNAWCMYKSYIRDTDYGREGAKMIVVGTKCDFEEEQISKIDGEESAAKYNLKFFETSAKTGHNVDLVFTTLLEDIFSERTFHVDHVESQVEVDERKQINLGFFSKFKKVFSRTKPTYSIHSVDSTNSRSSKENSSANGREIFTEQLLGEDRESPHQFAGTETVVEEFEPPDSQVLMPGPQVKTLDWSSCSQGTLQEVFNEPERANLDHISSNSQWAGLLSQRYSFEVDNIDEPEQADGKKSQSKAPTNDQEEDNGLKEDCAYIEPESRDVIEPVSGDVVEPESRDVIEPESRDVIEPESRDVVELESSLFLRSINDRNPTEDVDNTDYKCLLNIPNIITDES